MTYFRQENFIKILRKSITSGTFVISHIHSLNYELFLGSPSNCFATVSFNLFTLELCKNSSKLNSFEASCSLYNNIKCYSFSIHTFLAYSVISCYTFVSTYFYLEIIGSKYTFVQCYFIFINAYCMDLPHYFIDMYCTRIICFSYLC